jgi:dihydroflavonol-4-reductase
MATKTTKPAARKTRTKTASKTASIAKKPQPWTLVTGGTGFLGRHLVQQLLDAGVKNIRVLTTSAPGWLREMAVESVEGSINDPDSVKRAVDGALEVYHLAGKVSNDRDDARAMHTVHVEGTRLLCDAARNAGVRTIVMASTSGTIAVTGNGDPIPDESYQAPLDITSRWPYYASKFYQEQVALERFSGEGLRLVILNPSLLLGPGDERLSSTKPVLDFLAQKIRAIPGGGLSFVDVRDTATAFIEAMRTGKHGERYLLGSVNWTFKTFLSRLERLTKTPAPFLAFPSRFAVTGAQVVSELWRHWNLAPPVNAAEVDMAEHFWYLDSSKAKRELGFSPRDPGETLQDTVVYIRENFLPEP